MAIARASALSNGAVDVSSVTVADVPGGSDLAFVAFVDVRTVSDTITSISGGGLTWGLQGKQNSNRLNHYVSMYTAVGSPSAFDLAVSFSDAVGTRVVAVLGYSGVDVNGTPFEQYKGRNITGYDDAGDGGRSSATDTTALTITLVPTQDNGWVVNGAAVRTAGASTMDADYSTAVAPDFGAGGERLHLYAIDRLLATAASETIDNTAGVVCDWVMQAIALRPYIAPAAGLAPPFAPPARRLQHLLVR